MTRLSRSPHTPRRVTHPLNHARQPCVGAPLHDILEWLGWRYTALVEDSEYFARLYPVVAGPSISGLHYVGTQLAREIQTVLRA